MTDSLSAGDLLALTKDNAGMWDNPFIYLVWLAVLGRGGLFGGNFNGGFDLSTLQSAITAGNATQDTFRNFGQISSEINGFEREATASWGNIRYDMMNGFCGIGQQIAENRYANQHGFCETNHNIDSVKAEAYKNTCAITNAIHSEAEATRALISQNTVQELRDKLEDRDRQLLGANFLLSQANQSAELIHVLKPTPIPAYTVTSPYQFGGTY